jgi:hypothetical protein
MGCVTDVPVGGSAIDLDFRPSPAPAPPSPPFPGWRRPSGSVPRARPFCPRLGGRAPLSRLLKVGAWGLEPSSHSRTDVLGGLITYPAASLRRGLKTPHPRRHRPARPPRFEITSPGAGSDGWPSGSTVPPSRHTGRQNAKRCARDAHAGSDGIHPSQHICPSRRP